MKDAHMSTESLEVLCQPGRVETESNVKVPYFSQIAQVHPRLSMARFHGLCHISMSTGGH